MSCHANEEYYERRYQDLIEQYESEGYTWEDAERLAYCKIKDEEEQQRRDEKNGLYPDREDIAN